MWIYGARLHCRPSVRVLVGPVVGEVTDNSAVSLLFQTYRWMVLNRHPNTTLRLAFQRAVLIRRPQLHLEGRKRVSPARSSSQWGVLRNPAHARLRQVILLEVDIPPGLGPAACVSCHVSLSDEACPRGRVVASVSSRLFCRRPRAFRIGGGTGDDLLPGRRYTACFGGICAEDARRRVAR